MIEWILLGLLACVLSEPTVPLFPSMDGVTHWSVNSEEGKIQMQLPSQFALRRPHDFVNFMQQEQRAEELRLLEQELLSYRYRLHQFQSMMGHSELPLRSSDPDCRAAELPLSAYNLHLSSIYPLSSKGIREETHVHPVPKTSDYNRTPRCRDLPLAFSMHALEHLPSLAERDRLRMQPETTISGSMRYPVDDWGDMVHFALTLNMTSWVLLNQAAVFWRVKGEATEAVECLRRALHFSLWENKDVALLNLANVQHLSGHSSDAVVSLRQALEVTPTSGIAHYMLGNVYAYLKQYNLSAHHYLLCHEVQPSFAAARSQYTAALCELKVKSMLEQHARELGQARAKLDQFYRKLSEMQKHQEYEDSLKKPPIDNLSTDGLAPGPAPGEGGGAGAATPPPRPPAGEVPGEVPVVYEDIMEELAQDEYYNEEPRVRGEIEAMAEELREVVLDIDSGKIDAKGGIMLTKYIDEKRIARKKRQLEEELERVREAELSDRSQPADINTVFGDGEAASDRNTAGSAGDDSSGPSGSVDQASSSGRQNASNKDIGRAKVEAKVTRESEIQTSSTVSGTFQSADQNCKSGGDCGDTMATKSSISPHTHNTRSKPKIVLSSANKAKGLARIKNIPYADGLFPVVKWLVPPVHDADWPGFSSCMDFDQQLSSWKKITSTMIDPGSRSVSFDQVFEVLPQQIPSRHHHTEPYCTDIIDVPFSAVALDHLPGVQMRREYSSLKGPTYAEQEPLLAKILSKAADRKKVGLVVTQLGEEVYKALLRRGPSWVLFNLAALYWRMVGAPRPAVNCLRLAVHMCPRVHRDVGLVGMANVLRRLGRLEDALKAGQAALDINFDEPVTHYTLAIILSSLSDYNTSMLHLKFALMLDPLRSEVEELLKALKCIELLKREKDSLERELKRATMSSCDKGTKGCQDTSDSVASGNSNHGSADRVTDTNLFSLLDGHRKDLIADIRNYFKKLEDPLFTPGERLFPPGLSLARGGGPIASNLGQFERELEDALIRSSRPEDLNVTYWTSSWPTAEDCEDLAPLEPFNPISAALLPTSRGVDLSQYMDLETKFSESELSFLPFCKELSANETTVNLDHIQGLGQLYFPEYKAESTLMEDFLNAFQPVDYTLEEAASRLRQALDKNASCWVANAMAGIYWRVSSGNGEMSVRCLKAALQTAPAKHRDIAYQNIAFVLARSGYLESATEVVHLGLQVAPKEPQLHFSLAVIFYLRGMIPECTAYLENCLKLNAQAPLSSVAIVGLRTLKCEIVTKRQAS